MSASSRGGSRGGSRPRRIAQKLSRLILRRQTLRLLLKLTAISTALCVLLQWLLAYPIRSDQRLVPPQLQDAKNLLVVTAHPDDECLFFAPAILGVLGSGGGDVRGGLLVLSTGNNYGLGEVRRKELAGSCRLLGVEEGRCVALDRLELQDDPNVWWDESIIQGIVKEYIQKWNIDAILTFDEGGVSGHINHRAVSAAITALAREDPSTTTPSSERIPTYVLHTTTLLRKYTFLYDLPLTSLPFARRILAAVAFPLRAPGTEGRGEEYGTRAVMANSLGRYAATRRAFASHESQYVWDRYLYLVLSRYVWVNDLRRVN